MDYTKQIIFLGEKYENIIKDSSIAIVGIGALGTTLANLAARLGFRSITLIDHDLVEESNLPRQMIFTESDINRPKAEAAKERLSSISKDIRITAHAVDLNKDNLNLLRSDLVFDCTDNLPTRHLINQYCKDTDTPWVHAASVGGRGIIIPFTHESYCFNCIYKDKTLAITCEDEGIINFAASIIASWQMAEGVKILTKKREDHLLFIDIWNNSFDKIKVKRHPDCEVCNKEKKTAKKFRFDISYCKTKAALEAKPNKIVSLDLDRLGNIYDSLLDTKLLKLIKDKEGNEIVVHIYGKILFKNLKDEDKAREIAKEIYSLTL